MPRYIGGTTQTYEFDFFTKTAGSTVGCPLKIYRQDVDLASLPNPSTGWTENTTQSDLDMLKQQDGIALTKSTTTSEKARAMMIELDMTDITQNVYGNSNANMKSNYQTTSNVDLYVVGSGANAGATSYGCKSYAWNNTTSQWELLGENTNGTIQLTNRVLNKVDYISSTNKTYILLVSSYPSDGTIASAISLDYLKFKMNFNRTADSVVPLTHNFANKWTILLKDLFFMNINNPKPIKVGSIDINLSSIISSKKMHNVLIYQDGTNIKYYAIANNGTLQSGTVSASLVLGTQNITFNTSDYYFGMICVLNSYIPADSNEGLAILKGEKAGFENAELLYSTEFDDISKWTLANNAQISNKKLILSDFNSTATQNVFVFPNNQYEIQLTKKDQMGVVEVEEYYSKNSDVNSSVSNDVFIRSQILGAGLTKFTTSAYTNKIRVKLKNQLEGFSRSSVAYKSDGTQVAVNQPRLETGAFAGDKALMIEEGTVNLVPNPVAKIDLTAINKYSVGNMTYQREINLPSGSPFNTGVKVIVNTDNDCNLVIQQTNGDENASGIPVSPNTTYTISYWGYIPEDSGISALYIRPIEFNSSLAVVKDNAFNAVLNIKGAWVRKTFTLTTQSTTSKIKIRINSTGTGIYYATGFQLEAKPYATSFIDGTRQPEMFKIPTTGIINSQEGAIELIFTPKSYPSYAWSSLLDVGGYVLNSTKDNILIQWGSGGGLNKVRLIIVNSVLKQQKEVSVALPSNLQIGNTYYVCARWKNNDYSITVYDFAAGQKYSYSTTISGFTVLTNFLLSYMNLGTNAGANETLGQCNCAFSDVRFANIYRSDAEIQQAYQTFQAGQKLPVDQYTTYKLDFDSMSGAEISKISLKEKF